MSEKCGAEHPTMEGVVCDKDLPCWAYHESIHADVIWDGIPLPEKSQTKASAERKLNKVAENASAAVTTGPPVIERPDPQTVAKWESEAGDWISVARRTLYEFCQRNALFTTRDVWRLLDNPPGDDRRKMVVVTQYGVRKGWLEESGQYLRQTEPYVTRDGVSFPMNKAVPIYRSRLVG
jgi:hypothetical protein